MKILMIIFLVFLLLMIGEIIRELRHFQVTHYTVRSPKLSGMKGVRRVIFLSDLHNYCYGKENEALYGAIKKEKPDLILVGGDMLIRKNGHSFEGTAEFLSRLTAVCPVYCANGNHEQKLKEEPWKYEQSYQDYKDKLLSAGIHFLENESETLRWDEAVIRITGLEIPMHGYDYDARGWFRAEDVKRRIGRSTEVYEILLAHHPGHINIYKEWGADLILSGHYHGGVMRIPGIGGVIAPDFKVFPRYSGGCYRVGEASAIVSRGLGVHSVSVRLFNPAEVIVIEIRPCEMVENLV